MHAAFVSESTVLLRGSGYVAFDGKPPDKAIHAGVASTYAHTTAPLRRLVDRYVGEVCVAVSGGTDVPEWARAALPELPETMDVSNRLAHQYEAGIVSTVEAAVLESSVGQTFEAVVVDVDERRRRRHGATERSLRSPPTATATTATRRARRRRARRADVQETAPRPLRSCLSVCGRVRRSGVSGRGCARRPRTPQSPKSTSRASSTAVSASRIAVNACRSASSIGQP